MEQNLSSIQRQLAGCNIGLRAELTALHKVLSRSVESVKRSLSFSSALLESQVLQSASRRFARHGVSVLFRLPKL